MKVKDLMVALATCDGELDVVVSIPTSHPAAGSYDLNADLGSWTIGSTEDTGDCVFLIGSGFKVWTSSDGDVIDIEDYM
jgi:hypothetical protein